MRGEKAAHVRRAGAVIGWSAGSVEDPDKWASDPWLSSSGKMVPSDGIKHRTKEHHVSAQHVASDVFTISPAALLGNSGPRNDERAILRVQVGERRMSGIYRA